MQIHKITDAHPLPDCPLRMRSVIDVSAEAAVNAELSTIRGKLPSEVWVWDKGPWGKGMNSYVIYYREEK